MTKAHSKVERRLLGTWRSDRRRTLQFYKPGPQSTHKGHGKFKSIFGKLIVRWTARRCYFEFDGTRFDGERWSEPYEVVATDETSVVVRTAGVDGAPVLSQIHFEGDYYWIAVSGFLCEYFRRIA
ncbi:MAG TPA: hypothetical protein VGP76_08695 [Planctomycetaceae bacterium]|nr:hypothetical protein [Planctomycetaceae bacterium]